MAISDPLLPLVLSVLSMTAIGLSAQDAEDSLVTRMRASVVSDPIEVEVGEPMTWSLEVHHPRELIPILPGVDFGLGQHWVVLEELGTLSEASPDGIDEPGFWITRKRWTVMGLAGTKVLPSIEIFFGEGAGALSLLTPEGELRVKSLLGEGEQYARRGRGFRDSEASSGPAASLPWWIVAPASTLVLVLIWWVARRKGGRRSLPSSMPPLDRLASMEQALPDDLQALQSLHYSLTTLVREAIDEKLGKSFAGTTDREWLECIRGDGRVGDHAEQNLEQVISGAESVKYARIKPTRWAVEETMKAARQALEQLQENAGGVK